MVGGGGGGGGFPFDHHRDRRRFGRRSLVVGRPPLKGGCCVSLQDVFLQRFSSFFGLFLCPFFS